MCTCRGAPPSLPPSRHPSQSQPCRECNASFRYAKARFPSLPSSGQLSALAGMFYELANWVGTTVFLGCSPLPPSSLPPVLPCSVRNSLVRFQRCAITKPSSFTLYHVIRFEENLPAQRAGSPCYVTQQSREGHLSNEMEPFTGFGMMSSLPCLCTCSKLVFFWAMQTLDRNESKLLHKSR